jgi:hypothetical protein
LEGWREWVLVLSGGQPWLGHSPSPWVEHFDGAVRIWPDGGMGEDFPPIAGTITAPLDTVAALLHAAHQDLRGFLSVARRWVQEIAPSVAGDLTAKLDEGFQITRNLESSERTPHESAIAV